MPFFVYLLPPVWGAFAVGFVLALGSLVAAVVKPGPPSGGDLPPRIASALKVVFTVVTIAGYVLIGFAAANTDATASPSDTSETSIYDPSTPYPDTSGLSDHDKSCIFLRRSEASYQYPNPGPTSTHEEWDLSEIERLLTEEQC